jgi:anti-anti-sigma regulatory factor
MSASTTTRTGGDDAVCVSLPASCTLRDSLALKALLVDQLALGVDIHIDAGAVERIDTAGLQLLAALARELGDRQQSIRWGAASAPLRAAAERIGVAGLLGLPLDGACGR